MQLPVSEQWQGPVKSAYGWHAVLVTDRAPAATQPFAQVAERVASDAQQAARRAANEAYYEQLKGRYEVNYPDIEAAGQGDA